jgi:predicted small metal-binding protein
MMKDGCYELRCSDLGLKCDYVAKGLTMDELMEDASRHTREVHDKTSYTDEEMVGIKAAITHHHDC